MPISPDVRALNPDLSEEDLEEVAAHRPPAKRYKDKSIIFHRAWELRAPVGAPAPVREYHFAKHVDRKFRFDFAWPRTEGGGLAVEVDGGQHIVRKSKDGTRVSVGGRHNTDTDREKLNLAAELGWVVLRYSPKMLTRDPLGALAQVGRALITLNLWTPDL